MLKLWQLCGLRAGKYRRLRRDFGSPAEGSAGPWSGSPNDLQQLLQRSGERSAIAVADRRVWAAGSSPGHHTI
jgi:hypothetical protein